MTSLWKWKVEGEEGLCYEPTSLQKLSLSRRSDRRFRVSELFVYYDLEHFKDVACLCFSNAIQSVDLQQGYSNRLNYNDLIGFIGLETKDLDQLITGTATRQINICFIPRQSSLDICF